MINPFKLVSLLLSIRSVGEGILKEDQAMQTTGSTTLWNRFLGILHTWGPQIINIVLMMKGILPPQYGVWVSVVLGLGGYAIHVYHDVKTGGASALAADLSLIPETVTATATASTKPS